MTTLLKEMLAVRFVSPHDVILAERYLMEFEDVVAIGREFLVMALILVSPVVVVSLFIGLTVSIFQTVTSIQEQTLTFAPRIVAVVIVMMFMMNWYLEMLDTYTIDAITEMVEYVR